MNDELPERQAEVAGKFLGVRAVDFVFTLFALLVAVAAAVNESLIFQSRRDAQAAQRLADGPRREETLDAARRALALDGNNAQALYIRAVKLKDSKLNEEIAVLNATLERVLLLHPNQASVRRLAGEIAFRRQEHERAADLLWEAMWINPVPPSSPANFWRMTMAASAASGRQNQAVAAGLRAMALAPSDPFLNPEERTILFLEVARQFERAGWKLAASHVRGLAGSQD